MQLQPVLNLLNAGGPLLGGGGPVLFTPLDLGVKLLQWLDITSGITEEAGGVSLWLDQSVNGRDVSQTVSGDRPNFSATSLNSTPGITFNGTTDYLTRAPFMWDNGNASVFMTAQIPANQPDNTIISEASTVSNNPFYELLRTTGQSRSGIFIRNDGLSSLVFNNDTGIDYADNTTKVIQNIDTGSVTAIWADGLEQAIPDTYTRAGSLTSDNYTLGARQRTTLSAFTNFTCGHVVVTTGDLTTFERQQVEGFLAWSAGIEANLPPGHPFLGAPP